MKKAIHKIQLSTYQSPLKVPLRKGAEILTVQNQYDQAAMWVKLDLDNPIEVRTIVILTTGNYIGDEPGKYISTVQFNGGAYVAHFFDAGIAE